MVLRAVGDSDAGSLAVAAAALAAGGIVGLPTETVYGVGVLPRPEALEALLAAKQRPADKGIALLIDDLDQVDGLVVRRRRRPAGWRSASGRAR